MKLKYILFYSILILIISLTIYLMFIISNSTRTPKQNQYIDKIINSEATKTDPNLFWIYDSSVSTDNNIIPMINIKNKDVDKINKELEKQKKIENGSYIYSITGDLLSIMYSNNNNYLTYNINLGTNKVLNNLETLEYVDIDILKVKETIKLSTEMYLKSKNLNEEEYIKYYNKTIDEFNSSITNNELKIYVLKNKDINIIINVYLSNVVETKLINVVDI